jgi:hypothetical protein
MNNTKVPQNCFIRLDQMKNNLINMPKNLIKHKINQEKVEIYRKDYQTQIMKLK